MFDEALVEELKAKHIGKWLAVKGRQVLAIADSHEEVCRALEGKDWDGAYIFYAPTEEDKGRHFLFEASVWT